jgi:uncharacterized protein YcnI
VRARFRAVSVTLLAGFVVAVAAGPAFAHVEVSADKTTAGATDVTLTFNGEAENDAAGIASERVVLPQGVDPAGVTLVKAPAGWTFQRTADGFTVGGKALRTGVDAEWKVKVAKLPDGQTRLSFKTLETYGDGDVSRWIEIQEPGQAEPDNPAPLVTLRPAAPAQASTPAEASSTPGEASSAPAVASSAPAATVADDSSSTTSWLWVVLATLGVIGLVLYYVRRRSAAAEEN